MDMEKLVLHSYQYVSELSTEELEALISETTLDIDEVPYALDELYKRDALRAIELGKNIMERPLDEYGYYQDGGFLVDKYLQASVVDFFASRDKEYLIDYISRYLDNMASYVYASVLKFLTDEAEQPLGKKLPDSFLRRVSGKYQSYDDSQKSESAEEYESFLKAYSQRLQSL